MSEWSFDHWGDFITIGAFFVALVVASYFAILRTWRWERLGLALTLLFGVIAVLFGLGFFATIFGPMTWMLRIRWLVRIIGTSVAIYAVVIMATDDPMNRRDEP